MNTPFLNISHEGCFHILTFSPYTFPKHFGNLAFHYPQVIPLGNFNKASLLPNVMSAKFSHNCKQSPCYKVVDSANPALRPCKRSPYNYFTVSTCYAKNNARFRDILCANLGSNYTVSLINFVIGLAYSCCTYL